MRMAKKAKPKMSDFEPTSVGSSSEFELLMPLALLLLSPELLLTGDWIEDVAVLVRKEVRLAAADDIVPSDRSFES